MHPLVHGDRRDLSRWAGAEENAELLWGLSEMAVELFSFADVWECTCVHCRIDKRCTPETVYSLGWEDMGVVVELEEWTLVVVGLADEAGVALAIVVKVVVPDGGRME